MKKIWLKVIVTTLLIFPFCMSSVQAEDIIFGVYTSDKPTAMYRKFNPIIDYLQNHLKKQGIERTIKIKIYPTYDGAIEAITKGNCDFARFGPASYILAKKRNNGIRLLCMEHKKGKKRFNGVFITRRDENGINSLADFKGKRFAFGNKNSTIGRYLSQAEFVKNNVYASDLKQYAYLGRHDKVALAVASGKYDGGVVKENTFEKYAEEKELKKIFTFPNVTKPWVVRAGLNEQIYSVLQDGMLKLKDKKILKSLKQHGFLPATDGDYDFVRKGMEVSEKFDQ